MYLNPKHEINYEELLKEELDKLAIEAQKLPNELTLEKKLGKKLNEMQRLLYKNEKNLYIIFIIKNCLFFIKDNEFKNDSYFSLLKNDIYKYFSELLLNPCQKQFCSFQKGFENLSCGGDIIYLLSKKISVILNMDEYDLFFSITIKDNTFHLEKLLDKNNIMVNHQKIINKLKTFEIIKSNYHNVKPLEAYNFFLKTITNPNINTAINKENKIIDTLKDNKKQENKFLKYLIETKKLYENIRSVPVLDYLIKNNGKLEIKYFRYKEDKDPIFNDIYSSLEKLINDFNNDDFIEDTQGYFCYKDETTGLYVESLYSKIDLNFLFNKIIFDNNFYKSLIIEYYINKNVTIDKFKMKERPRVFYPFKSLNAILENIEENGEKNNLFIELGGVILEKKEYDLSLEKNVFIINPLYQLSEIMPFKNEKVFEPYLEKGINLKKNELCIIDIKKQPTNFCQMIKELIKKAKIYKQFCDFKNEKVDSIRLILFYDEINKKRYYEDLRRVFAESFEENDKSRLLYKFQCIYIKSSFSVTELYNIHNKFNIFSKEISIMKGKVDEINEEKTKFEEDLKAFKIKSFEDNVELKNQIINLSKEIKTLKTFFESNSKSKKEIIDCSKKMLKAKEEYFNSKNENEKEIINLNEPLIELKKENISLKEDISDKPGLIQENPKKIIQIEEIKKIMSDVLNHKIKKEDGLKMISELLNEI